MLRTNTVHGSPQVRSPDETSRSLPVALRFARREWAFVSATVCLGLLIGCLYVLFAKPVYTARTYLMIEPRKAQPFAQQAILSELVLDATFVDSQVQVLGSEAVRLAIIKKLNLL